MDKKTLHNHLEQIRNTTSIKIASYKVITKGSESEIIEVNKKWIFRFPRNFYHKEKMQKRLDFLLSFSKLSPIPIPAPGYIANNFIGYQKLMGNHLYPTQIEKLLRKDAKKIAKQLGLFLKALHNFKHKTINFNTGYLVMRRKDYLSVPARIAKHLSMKEQAELQRKLLTISRNPINFKKPTAIIHGDLNFNNILWNKNTNVLSGILDWSDTGLGTPAMDFIALADFNSNRNDTFLKEVLREYGAGENLFSQIKENAIIEVMNWFWFYDEKGDKKSLARIIKKLKKILKTQTTGI